MTINLILQVQLDYLHKGFELELYALHELPMVFNYLRYIYQMLVYNRRPMFLGLVEDLAKINLINWEDLDNSAAKFK
jgi:hypothetical protein